MDERMLGKDGFVRIRYWPLLALSVYLAINLITGASLAFGSAHPNQVESGFELDPFLHAPIIWLLK
jgi:hypothetical protein